MWREAIFGMNRLQASGTSWVAKRGRLLHLHRVTRTRRHIRSIGFHERRARRYGERIKHRQVTQFSCAKCRTFSFATELRRRRRLQWSRNTQSKFRTSSQNVVLASCFYRFADSIDIFMFSFVILIDIVACSIYKEFIKCVGFSFWARAWPVFAAFLCFNYSYNLNYFKRNERWSRHSSQRRKANRIYCGPNAV